MDLKETQKKPRMSLMEINTVTSVHSSIHHGKHQDYDFTRTFPKLCKP